jgi:acyl carrier protein
VTAGGGDSLSDRVRAIVLDMAPIQDREISDTTLLVEDLGYDSLGLIELAAAIEHELALAQISSADAGEVASVGDVERLVERLSVNSHAR